MKRNINCEVEMYMYRINPMGLRYLIVPDPKARETRTLISYNGKQVVVEMPVDEFSQCWYNWQMKGQVIQEAFQKLKPAEREFLITGLTPKEWDKIFKDTKEQ